MKSTKKMLIFGKILSLFSIIIKEYFQNINAILESV